VQENWGQGVVLGFEGDYVRVQSRAGLSGGWYPSQLEAIPHRAFPIGRRVRARSNDSQWNGATVLGWDGTYVVVRRGAGTENIGRFYPHTIALMVPEEMARVREERHWPVGARVRFVGQVPEGLRGGRGTVTERLDNEFVSVAFESRGSGGPIYIRCNRRDLDPET
jgi:hypothetical protein